MGTAFFEELGLVRLYPVIILTVMKVIIIAGP